MKRGNLPRAWVQWRRYHYQGLVADGLAKHLAWELAKAEAKYRHGLSSIIRSVRARSAELIDIGGEDDLQLALAGDTIGLSDEQIARLQKRSDISIAAIQ